MQLTIISGASSGIGAALAELSLEAGHTVATISRRPGPGTHLAADLSDPASWPKVSGWIDGLASSGEWDRIVFVHNAGAIAPVGFAGEVDTADYTSSVMLNGASAQVLGERFLASAADFGCPAQYLAVSSGAGKTAIPGWSAYCAGKAAVDMWVRVAGAEQAARDRGVTVVSLAPGVVDTAMQGTIRDQPEAQFPAIDRFIEMHETGALLAPAVVAEFMLELIGADAGDTVRGQVIDNGAILDIRDFSPA